ncbi:MAG: prephenate dehydrogenase/arogenate dehydrogenase family protein, partial [Rhodocyclaceae bacterium]|nr:prephenate dehydrogenase/arogenate dehydrogenase family protein [Rhodocyclaceae bacterium]
MTDTPLIGRLVVCGVGLIGGSFALALRAAGAVGHVVGYGRTRAALERAQALGVIDSIADDWQHALAGADMVLLAVPVGQIAQVMADMAPHLAPGTIVTDAGSTKRDVIEAIYEKLDGQLARVVPAHPIAGAEKSGVDAA